MRQRVGETRSGISPSPFRGRASRNVVLLAGLKLRPAKSTRMSCLKARPTKRQLRDRGGGDSPQRHPSPGSGQAPTQRRGGAEAGKGFTAEARRPQRGYFKSSKARQVSWSVLSARRKQSRFLAALGMTTEEGRGGRENLPQRLPSTGFPRQAPFATSLDFAPFDSPAGAGSLRVSAALRRDLRSASRSWRRGDQPGCQRTRRDVGWAARGRDLAGATARSHFVLVISCDLNGICLPVYASARRPAASLP